VGVEIRKKKKGLIDQIDKLDVLAEQNTLSTQEREAGAEWKKELERIMQMEETKAWQRSRERYIREGDKNHL
jgi:hypothetical protein